MRKFTNEREGQIEFFENYGIPYNEESILIENTDGVYNGNILEFKLNISNINSTLFQAIKYLSRMRVKGESIPKTILLIDLNAKKVYQYNSKDYIKEIQEIYIGQASKNNENFVAKEPEKIYNYSDMLDSSKLKKQLIGQKKYPEDMYIPIDIDENCIVGWGERYYRENPIARKGDFLGDDVGVNTIGEIRKPIRFKGLINPYTEDTNERFKYLMDCLNDRLQKKDLGAFYTPIPYCKKAAELVLIAVNRAIDAGKKDYIILDRCAGTGNLETALIGLYDKNGDELINHSVVSTYEYYEYKVLNERIGDKVRDIIPPTVSETDYSNGVVIPADAMSEAYINNPIIKQYLDDEDCAIIMFENPPYRDETSGMVNGVSEKSGKRETYISKQMSEVGGTETNELANQFIWSAFKYYVRDFLDSYIVFGPIKYWKQYNFVNKTPRKSFAFNRKHFHATPSTITCILWENKQSSIKEITTDVYDIIEGNLISCGKIKITKVGNTASKHYTKTQFNDTDICTIWCSKDGTEAIDKKKRVKSYTRDDIIAYLEADSFQISPHVRSITRHTLYNGNGCYITKENYENIIPIWVAKHIPLDNWYEKDIYATTSDGGDAYIKDPDFLKSCLIYTCLSNQNKCLSFTGSDGRYYNNELCFDEKTLASKDLEKYQLDKTEEELMELWKKILEGAKKAKNYNKGISYGVYQITKELNTFKTEIVGTSKKKVYDYPELNGDLDTLRVKLKNYYNTHIREKMFKYELVK